MAADVYLIVQPCHVRSPVTFGLAFGNWTCWNTLFLTLTVYALTTLCTRVHLLQLLDFGRKKASI